MADHYSKGYRQLRIFVDVLEGTNSASLTVFARVGSGGRHRDRLLVSVDLDTPLDDLNTAETLRCAGELMVREAFRMAQPAPQAPRGKTDHSGRVLTALNRSKSLR
jgi:hypothetical protein